MPDTDLIICRILNMVVFLPLHLQYAVIEAKKDSRIFPNVSRSPYAHFPSALNILVTLESCAPSFL